MAKKEVIETLAQATRRLICTALNLTETKKEAFALLAPQGAPTTRSLHMLIKGYKIAKGPDGEYA